MSANRDREEEIFDAAREISAHERAAFLAEKCGQDADLRQRIEGMLQADAAAGEFFKTDVAPSSTAVVADAKAEQEILAPYDYDQRTQGSHRIPQDLMYARES